MMGRQNNDQGPLFYEFRLDEAVPDDHLVRTIDAVLDLSWVYAELAPHYPTLGRPSIDPVLMIRMLIIGYVFGLRSERLLCREVQVTAVGGVLEESRQAPGAEARRHVEEEERRAFGPRHSEPVRRRLAQPPVRVAGPGDPRVPRPLEDPQRRKLRRGRRWVDGVGRELAQRPGDRPPRARPRTRRGCPPCRRPWRRSARRRCVRARGGRPGGAVRA